LAVGAAARGTHATTRGQRWQRVGKGGDRYDVQWVGVRSGQRVAGRDSTTGGGGRKRGVFDLRREVTQDVMGPGPNCDEHASLSCCPCFPWGWLLLHAGSPGLAWLPSSRDTDVWPITYLLVARCIAETSGSIDRHRVTLADEFTFQRLGNLMMQT
jgi:hypothetical protein